MAVTERRFVRADGLEKVTGQGRYTADLVLPGMAHAAFLYAGRAYARISRLDTSRARAIRGVVAVLTQADVPHVRTGMMVKDRTLFADGVVRFEGEIVAAVAALTPELAEEALAAIEVEYEPLEPITDPEVALAEGAPLLHPEWASYEGPPVEVLPRRDNYCSYSNIVKGDVERGFAEADIVVEERYEADMSHGVAIEPHAVLADWQGKRLTVWSSTQVPYAARGAVAAALQVPEHAVRVIVPLLGGGFGSKCEAHFEPHVAALARAAGRPVRLVFDRREEFTAIDMTRHGIVTEVKTGLKKDGTIVARQARHTLDTGAYAGHGPLASETATMMGAGPYRIPNLFIEGRSVYTNRTPAGSVRAPTGPQICWAIEQHTDVCAERVGLDPVAFRLKNLTEDGDEGPTGQRLTSVGTKECLERAAEMIGWGRELPDGEGIGLAASWWFSIPMPSSAHVQLNPDGSATIVTGAQENGSGSVMALPLLVAEELGIDPENVAIHYQDTDAAPFDLGSAGSQTTYNNGRAVLAAAQQVRHRLLELAAGDLEADPADLEVADGAVRVRGATDRFVAVGEVVGKAFGAGELLVGSGGAPPAPMPESDVSGCAGRLVFPAFQAAAYAVHAVRVRVDRETGVTRVLEAAAAQDFGTILNPPGVRNQVEGGMVHGFGMALLEGAQLSGGRQLNPHLLDYKLQTAADPPLVKVALLGRPAPDGGPRGAKGVGESALVPTTGAVGNAIAAATGVRVRRLPMTPERTWAALQGEEA